MTLICGTKLASRTKLIQVDTTCIHRFMALCVGTSNYGSYQSTSRDQITVASKVLWLLTK